MASQKHRTPSLAPASKRKQRGDSQHAKVLDNMSRTLSNTNEVLESLQQKVDTSPVLNGGFDKLVFKIDSMGEKVNAVHDAVFNPDDGLFARIKTSEAVQADKVADVKREVAVLQSWKSDIEQHTKLDAESTLRLVNATKELERQVVDINKWRTTTMAILKWLAATIATGGGGLVAKILYELATKTM